MSATTTKSPSTSGTTRTRGTSTMRSDARKVLEQALSGVRLRGSKASATSKPSKD